MASSLLDRSLDDLAKQGRDSSSRRGGRGARGGGRTASGSSGRSAPYAKRAPKVDPDADTWKHDLFNTGKLDYDEPSSSSRAAASAPAYRDQGPRSTRLKVTNLHYEVSWQELKALFEQVGALAPPQGREEHNPDIKYDTSGRSLGEASVTYESEADAARAKEVFDNALAKGERISIEFDFTVPRKPRRQDDNIRFDSIPKGGLSGAGNPLLSRLQPAPAASRGRGAAPRDAGRSSDRGRGAPRGAPPARGAGAGSSTRGGRGGRRDGGARPSKTTEDLDRELEEFMASGNSNEKATEDTEMA